MRELLHETIVGLKTLDTHCNTLGEHRSQIRCWIIERCRHSRQSIADLRDGRVRFPHAVDEQFRCPFHSTVLISDDRDQPDLALNARTCSLNLAAIFWRVSTAVLCIFSSSVRLRRFCFASNSRHFVYVSTSPLYSFRVCIAVTISCSL